VALRDMLPTKVIAIAGCGTVAFLAIRGVTGFLDTATIAVAACDIGNDTIELADDNSMENGN